MNLKLSITLIRIIFVKKVIAKALLSERKLIRAYNQSNKKLNNLLWDYFYILYSIRNFTML
ncbi:hypothetical protein [Methanobrevibacter cuticularis]|uniref:hypothetical protein n=1 Tax=Methanobrevibacter cuticularis TaxID=47311 RepID=UPI0012EDDBED|nr:hypothetical protein [Methanobrevibacter cuticularis]